MGSVATQGADRLRGFRVRFGRGERLDLEAVFLAAGLSRREMYVIGRRLRGWTFRQIAGELTGIGAEGMTRQRVEQLERQALGRLGVQASVAAVVHAQEREGNALAMLDRSKGVSAAELHGEQDGQGGAWVPLTRQEKALEAEADRILAAGRQSRRAG